MGIPPYSQPWSVFAADFDDDGDFDVATGNTGNGNVSILLNSGDGTFARAMNLGVGAEPMSVFGADIDADGDVDLAVANSYSDDVTILENLTKNPTDVAPNEEWGLPRSMELIQNNPNPFNSGTTIEYTVPKQAQVTIEIFNILGQKVRTLVDETKPVGTYRIEWNGVDNAGKSVSTRVYLYRFQAGDVVQTKKMLLVK